MHSSTALPAAHAPIPIARRTSTDDRPVVRAEFRVMGCSAEVEVVDGDDALVMSAVRQLTHLESVWSRFVPTSDISRLNAAGGEPCEVDPATIDLLVAMVDAHAATDGAFDPTLLVPLVGLGYLASRHDASMSVAVPSGIAPRGAIDGVAVHRGVGGSTSWARLPVGTALDAGGIGKGLAADLVTFELLAAGASGAMVSVGGDVRVAGRGPNAGEWQVAVSDGRRVVDVLRLRDGGIATSGTVHHQIDPVTGREAVGGRGLAQLEQATVVGGSAAWAEACATLAMVRGIDALVAIERFGLAARLQFSDSSVACTPAWGSFVAVGEWIDR